MHGIPWEVIFVFPYLGIFAWITTLLAEAGAPERYVFACEDGYIEGEDDDCQPPEAA